MIVGAAVEWEWKGRRSWPGQYLHFPTIGILSLRYDTLMTHFNTYIIDEWTFGKNYRSVKKNYTKNLHQREIFFIHARSSRTLITGIKHDAFKWEYF